MLPIRLLILPLVLAFGSIAVAETNQNTAPNIVVILADDLGIGDLSCYNADSKIRTPNCDRLAREGMRLTDAHSPGTWCIPTRYGLLTGNFPHRANTPPGLLVGDHAPTVARFLSEHGYHTAFVGKWHLGVELAKAKGDRSMSKGPHTVGFRYTFGIPASLDIPPYYYFENGHAVEKPTGSIEDRNSPESTGWTRIQGAFYRGGGLAPNFDHQTVLPTITDKAVDYIGRRADKEDPFFLYFALTAPHTPWLPSEEFDGKSQAGMYGDFTMQVDAAVGRVLDALDEAKITKETLIIFTSDNGPVWYPKDTEKYDHSATGPYRGMKADLWEGGHRMPFVARWPGQIPAGEVSGALFSQVDLFATFAAIVGEPIPEGTARDSLNQLPTLRGDLLKKPVRDGLLIYRNPGTNGVREGRWSYLPIKNSGGFSRWKPPKDAPAGQLYDLSADPGQTENRYDDHPELVERLHRKLPGKN